MVRNGENGWGIDSVEGYFPAHVSFWGGDFRLGNEGRRWVSSKLQAGEQRGGRIKIGKRKRSFFDRINRIYRIEEGRSRIKIKKFSET